MVTVLLTRHLFDGAAMAPEAASTRPATRLRLDKILGIFVWMGW